MLEKKEHPLISIIITNYNGGKLLLDCLDSVFASTYDNYEVILVDNASKDQSQLKGKTKFPKIKLVENRKNLGASGRNSGIKIAKGDFIVLLDNDTKVTPNWLIEFLKNYRKNGYGLYQGKLLLMDNPNKINSAGCMINIFGFSFARGSGEVDKGQYDEKIEINFPATACAFIPKDIFKKVGFFDLEFFAYLEDTDFGWRAMRQGIKSYFASSVVVYHKWSATTQWGPLKFYLLEKNRQICIHTLYSKKTFKKLAPFFKMVDIGVSLLYMKKRMLKEKLRADKFIKQNKKYISKRYLELQKKQKVDDYEIVKKFSDNIKLPSGTFEDVDLLNRVLKKCSELAKSRIR